jgi:hypothetical protein
MVIQRGWYRTAGGHLVRMLQWPDHESGGLANYGEVINVGTFSSGSRKCIGQK